MIFTFIKGKKDQRRLYLFKKKISLSLFVFFLTLVSFFPVLFSQSPSFKDNQLSVSLVSEIETYSDQDSFLVALHFKIKPKWHLYWKNPGETGLAPQIKWDLPKGFTYSNFIWKAPQRIEWKTEESSSITFGYENTLLLITKITPPKKKPKQPILIKAKLNWLVCEKLCLPGKAVLNLTLNITKKETISSYQSLIEKEISQLPKLYHPKKDPLTINVILKPKYLDIHLISKDPSFFKNYTMKQTHFFPYQEGVFDLQKKEKIIKKSPTNYIIRTFLDKKYQPSLKEIKALIAFKKNNGEPQTLLINLPLAHSSHNASSSTIPRSIVLIALYALLGGLLLNLMPCVFPILSIKILSFIEKTHYSFSKRLYHGGAYLLGVLGSLYIFAGLVIILRHQGLSVGWGFQLQSPIFVCLMIMLFFLMGLNLSGVFEIGQSLTRLGNLQKNTYNYFSSFVKGSLTVLISTPCTTPFMGVAMGYTLSQNIFKTFLIFSFLGIGVALPYITFLAFPKTLKWLPKAGPWMITLKQLMAFFIYGTVVWLFWVLIKQTPSQVLISHLGILIILSLSVWIFDTWGKVHLSKIKRYLVNSVTFLLIASCVYMSFQITTKYQKIFSDSQNIPTVGNQNSPLKWIPYSKEKLQASLNKGESVFINFTAAWCLTCQLNKVPLNSKKVIKIITEKNITLLEADWTKYDPKITQAIKSYHRLGVPLYVFYPNKVNGNKEKKIILPEVLTSKLLIKTFRDLENQ